MSFVANQENKIIAALFNKQEFKRELNGICCECLASLPKFNSPKEVVNLKVLYDYLKVFWEFDHNLPYIVRAAAEITKNTCLSGLRSLIKVLPVIDINCDEPPQIGSNETSFLQGAVINEALKSKYFRISIRVMNEMIIHHFLQEMFMENPVVSKNDIPLMIQTIINLLILPNEDIQYQQFHYFAAIKMSTAMYTLSKSSPLYVYTYIEQNLVPSKHVNIWELAVKYALFSQILLDSTVIFNHKTILKFFQTIIKLYDSKHCIPEVQEIIPGFLTNLLGTILDSHEEFWNSKFIYEIYTDLTKKISSSSYTGELFVPHAILQIFTEHPKTIMTIPNYFNLYFKKKINLDNIGCPLIKCMTLFLRGRHYLPPIALKRDHENYQWHIDDDNSIMYMFDLVVSNPTIFKDCQFELSEFLLQLISYNIPMFCVDNLSTIQSNAQFLENNSPALLLAFKQVLSSRSKFPYLGDSRKEIEPFVIECSLRFLSNFKNKSSEKPSQIAVVAPIMDSIDYFHGDIDMFALNIDKDGFPLVKVKNNSISYALLQKWLSLYQVNSDNGVLKKCEDDIVFGTGDLSNYNPTILQGITVFSVFGELPPIEQLPDCILNNDNFISSITMRFTATLAVGSEYLANEFISILTRLIKIDLGIPMNLYRIIYLMSEIVTVSKSRNFIFYPQYAKDLGIAIFYSLCSPSPFVRERAFSIVKNLKNIPLLDTINSILPEVSRNAWKHCLVALTFSNDRKIHEPDFLDFQTVLESPYDNIYNFYLANLVYKLKEVSKDISFESIIKSILYTLERVSQSTKSIDCPPYIASLIMIVLLFSEKCDDNVVYAMDLLTTITTLTEPQYEALFCCLSIQNISSIFDFSKNNKFSNGICFGIHAYASSHKLTNTDKNNSIKILTFFLENNKAESDRFHHNLLLAASTIFLKFPENNKTIFDLYSNQEIEYEKTIKSKIWFNYLYKQNEKDEIAMLTLASLLSFMSPPNNVFQSLKKEILDQEGKIYQKVISLKMSTLSENVTFSPLNNEVTTPETKVVNSFLRTNFVDLIDFYIENACESNGFIYFEAISKLFKSYENKNDFLNSIEEIFEDSKNNKKVAQIIETIYKHTGVLLALGFLYLTKDKSNIRLEAFSLIANVSLIACNYLNKRPLLGRTIEFLDSISQIFKTSLHSLCSHATKILTNYLAEEFSFCGEQFVFWMFQDMQDYPFHTELAMIVLPWINGVSFDFKKNKVFKNTTNEFVIFSCVSFVDILLNLPVSSNLLGIIDKIAHEKVSSSINVVEFLVKYIIMEGQFNGSSIINCKNITSYILSDRPDQVVPVLKYIFSFQMWLFMFNKNNSNNEEKSDENEEDKSDNKCQEEEDSLEELPKTYRNIVNFGFSVLRLTYDVWNISDNLTDFVLVFCLVNPLKTDLNSELKKILPHYKDIHRSNIQIYVRDYILSLSKERQMMIGKQFITWGLCCGDTAIATRALTWYSYLLIPSTKSILDDLISSIQICAKVLYEVTNQVSKDWQIRALTQDVKPETDKLIQYICEVFKILSNLIPNDDESHHTLFYISVSFLNCYGKEMNELIKNVLILISVLLEHQPTLNGIKNEQKPITFKGILYYFINTALISESVTLIHQIFMSLFKNDLTHLVYDGDKNKNFAMSLLFFNAISEFCGSTMHEDLLMIDNLESPFAIDICKNDLLKMLNETDLSLIVNLFDRFLSVLLRNAGSVVFRLCNDLITCKGIDAKVFAPIASRASYDVEPEHAAISLKFLTKVSKSGVSIDLTQQKPVLKKPFPQIYFPDDISVNRNFVTQSKLMFEEISMFPKHPIYDNSFVMSETVTLIKEQWSKINVWPMYEWEDMFKLAEDKNEKNLSLKEISDEMKSSSKSEFKSITMSTDLTSSAFMPSNIN
ncbi:hypothetical protein TVAG_140590 [Trichomonas vaginalis G3]|uniref:Uncharacterized protein n=1 Tax=Trichomonas vaginalis (strain ATCC PRA-98 / G3) TaxID=412133 RepID=A2EJU7_TRIV3|nr:hypothetical protein TVAGG3_0409300 [Trichomonas vaginalis G3]EAY07085.1 hypothetical protein TVAG_140590 [Trichomonas vaginalis G3]KAI5535240.1 hypothetical protein TVAGG3_0409300 [Trichomonas vaginalis G3]|eukprot:XP_001319308.1 hypothetical protein [Trichomonas vaginalis G3]